MKFFLEVCFFLLSRGCFDGIILPLDEFARPIIDELKGLSGLSCIMNFFLLYCLMGFNKLIDAHGNGLA